MTRCLNESPSEKEGKCIGCTRDPHHTNASMKALPKRKGNWKPRPVRRAICRASMKALPKRKGNINICFAFIIPYLASMKALPKRKGNFAEIVAIEVSQLSASMKALPKRKGN